MTMSRPTAPQTYGYLRMIMLTPWHCPPTSPSTIIELCMSWSHILWLPSLTSLLKMLHCNSSGSLGFFVRELLPTLVPYNKLCTFFHHNLELVDCLESVGELIQGWFSITITQLYRGTWGAVTLKNLLKVSEAQPGFQPRFSSSRVCALNHCVFICKWLC